jgi:pimeloyl-ACP methyl ester carboxylesterase
MWRWIARTARIVLLVLATGAVLLVGACFGARTWRHAEIARQTAIDPARGVDEALYVRLGGVEQWIDIRGQDRRNPVLLMLHGGPGIATGVYGRATFFDLTRDFTVVRWDQRGAGKTYSKSGPVGADVTLDRMAQDGIELAEFLRNRLHKPRIIVLGHSWGSMRGVRMAKARPDLFYAYVGTGQAVNQGVSKQVAYRQLLAKARARGDRQALDELTRNGPPPYATTRQAAVHTKWATAWEPSDQSTAALAAQVLLDSDAGLQDLRDYIRGIRASEDHFRAAVEHDDLRALGPDFEVPLFIFQGADDDVTPTGPVRAWFDGLRAPSKELVIIPDAGHNAILRRSHAFDALLIRKVRPLAMEPR